MQSAEQASAVVEHNAGEMNRLLASTLSRPPRLPFAYSGIRGRRGEIGHRYRKFGLRQLQQEHPKAVELAEANISAATKAVPQRARKVA